MTIGINSDQKTLLGVQNFNVNFQSFGGQVDHGGQLGLGSPDHHLLGKQTLQSSQGVCLPGQPKPGQVIYISEFDLGKQDIIGLGGSLIMGR